MNRKHPHWQHAVNGENYTITTCNNENSQIDEDSDDGHHDFFCVEETCSVTFPPTPKNPQRSAALFLLSLKEHHRVTQKAVDFTVSSMNEVLETVCESIAHSIDQMFENKSSLSRDEIHSCLAVTPKPFLGLETEHQQTMFYREHFKLVVGVFLICIS